MMAGGCDQAFFRARASRYSSIIGGANAIRTSQRDARQLCLETGRLVAPAAALEGTEHAEERWCNSLAIFTARFQCLWCG